MVVNSVCFCQGEVKFPKIRVHRMIKSAARSKRLHTASHLLAAIPWGE